jgi:hypothetical protein
VNQNTKEDIGDIDEDGKLDMVLAPAEAFRKGGDHDLAWYRNPGGNYDSPWKKTVIKANANNHHTVKLGDMDNDNDLDVVVGVPWNPQRVQIYYNNGKGSFKDHPPDRRHRIAETDLVTVVLDVSTPEDIQLRIERVESSAEAA